MALSLAACATHDRIVIARATKLPEEVRGFARIVQEDPIRVGIVGEDVVEARSLAGYLVVHEQDLARLIDASVELAALKAKH